MSSTAIREAKHFTTSGRTEYLTPKYILDAIGPFDLDPCASIVRPWPTATKHYTRFDDGLMQPWDGLVWLNPPFGRSANGCDCEGKCDCHDGNSCEPSEKHPDCSFTGRPRACEIDWVRKLAEHPGGGILLGCPSKTETKTWQDVIFPACSGVLFLTPRLKFCNTDGSAMAGTFGASCLVAFRTEAWVRIQCAIERKTLRGQLVHVLRRMF